MWEEEPVTAGCSGASSRHGPGTAAARDTPADSGMQDALPGNSNTRTPSRRRLAGKPVALQHLERAARLLRFLECMNIAVPGIFIVF